MITEQSIENYNNRLTLDVNKIKSMSASQLDQVRHYGSQAETLLKNRELAMFIHHYKFSIADELANIRGYTEQDNQQRVALSHQLVGIDDFINSLKKAVYIKNRIGNTEVPNT